MMGPEMTSRSDDIKLIADDWLNQRVDSRITQFHLFGHRNYEEFST